MSDTFPADVQQFVRQEIAAGRYRSEDELVLEAVRRLRDSDAWLQQLRQEVRSRLASLERGEGIVLGDDEALGAFLDQIEAEVVAEMAAGKKPTA